MRILDRCSRLRKRCQSASEKREQGDEELREEETYSATVVDVKASCPEDASRNAVARGGESVAGARVAVCKVCSARLESKDRDAEDVP